MLRGDAEMARIRKPQNTGIVHTILLSSPLLDETHLAGASKGLFRHVQLPLQRHARSRLVSELTPKDIALLLHVQQSLRKQDGLPGATLGVTRDTSHGHDKVCRGGVCRSAAVGRRGQRACLCDAQHGAVDFLFEGFVRGQAGLGELQLCFDTALVTCGDVLCGVEWSAEGLG